MVLKFLAESKTMKRWAVLTVLLYALALLALTLPAILIAFGNWGLKSDSMGIKAALAIYANWGYWFWLAIMIAGQALLLLLPINIAEGRLSARRPLKVPVIVTAFFLANLFFAGLLSLLCAIFTDGAFAIFDLQNFFNWMANTINHNPIQNAQTSNWQSNLSVFVPVLVFWLVWAIIFRRATKKTDEPAALLKRIIRWLLRGSILELIIAVPSHVIVRRRDDCCAPAGTFWGIATGISVMLLCFGPGVFFLFVERFQRLQPKETNQNNPTTN